MTDSHFSIKNLPFGIASRTPDGPRSVVTRLHDKIIFLEELAAARVLPDVANETLAALSQPTLNALAAQPKSEHTTLRNRLQTLLEFPDVLPKLTLVSADAVTLHLPLAVGTLTNYVCSTAHLLNASEALLKSRKSPPACAYFPIGYTARSNGIVVSGSGVLRPKGMIKDEASGGTIYSATRKLDFEMELAAVVGKSTELGTTVTSSNAGDYIFGAVLLNDWSARDIQGLEMTPLGPMNGKSFRTTISPWVVTTLALEPFACPSPPRPSTAAPYLKDKTANNAYSIRLSASLKSHVTKTETRICESNLKSLNWTLRDIVAHQTASGCALKSGDLLGTGAVSGEARGEFASLLENNKAGDAEIKLEDGEKIVWLRDGDEVKLSAIAGEGVGFGECTGVILPAK